MPQGLAKLDAFMNVDTGELMVIDLDTVPNLSADSPLFQQALLTPPAPPASQDAAQQAAEASGKSEEGQAQDVVPQGPLFPAQLLRAVVNLALTKQVTDEEVLAGQAMFQADEDFGSAIARDQAIGEHHTEMGPSIAYSSSTAMLHT